MAAIDELAKLEKQSFATISAEELKDIIGYEERPCRMKCSEAAFETCAGCSAYFEWAKTPSGQLDESLIGYAEKVNSIRVKLGEVTELIKGIQADLQGLQGVYDRRGDEQLVKLMRRDVIQCLFGQAIRISSSGSIGGGKTSLRTALCDEVTTMMYNHVCNTSTPDLRSKLSARVLETGFVASEVVKPLAYERFTFNNEILNRLDVLKHKDAQTHVVFDKTQSVIMCASIVLPKEFSPKLMNRLFSGLRVTTLVLDCSVDAAEGVCISEMFGACEIGTLDLTGFNIPKGATIRMMFKGAKIGRLIIRDDQVEIFEEAKRDGVAIIDIKD